jgi:anaerobic selenocysteine-containing dehydrogenase
MPETDPIETHYRVCDLCEAICGLEIKISHGKILSIRGDADDPLSKGHVCPKATALEDKQFDPDRLRVPMRRHGSDWQTIGWDEAIETVAEQLVGVRNEYGNDAIGTYFGNPAYHGLENPVYGNGFLSSFDSRNRYTVASVDHGPRLIASYWMYGHAYLLGVPDLDRTEYLVVLGGNPVTSAGSIMGAPGVGKRVAALRERGGKLVVIDPRRTETAAMADEFHFIRPETDAALLLAMLNTLVDEGLIDDEALPGYVDGVAEVAAWIEPFTAERAAPLTGIDAGTIRRLAREFANADRAVMYGRFGTNTQSYGAMNAWLIEVLNIVTGNLDRPGGMMFPKPAFDVLGGAPKGSYDTFRSRVSGRPECMGELPACVMAEEILTPGEGQIRAMVMLAGNPVLSFPNGSKLEQAFEQLDFMAAFDPYINESTRFADIILPPLGPLEVSRFDLLINMVIVRNVVRYNEPLFSKADDTPDDWEVFARLREAIARHGGPEAPPRVTPDEMLDAALRAGPYGEDTGHPAALTLEKIKTSPHGIDLGPMESCLPGRLFTPDKRIHCAVPEMQADLERVERELFGRVPSADLVLIGRRHLRGKNSWMHNYHRLVKGQDRCTLLMHPADLEERELWDGQTVCVRSRVGEVEVPVEASDAVMPGVVSLPHGWGHGRPGTNTTTANAYPGASINDLTDDSRVDPVSCNAAFSGTPVTVTAS